MIHIKEKRKRTSTHKVVDAYIPYRRSKAGKRFGFVRFIKVLDVDRLVNNLCTVWVRRHKLQANIPRFQREPLKRHSSPHNIDEVKMGNSGDTYNSNWVKGASNSYTRVVKGYQNSKMDSYSSPVMVLDDSCLKEKDYSLCLMGKIKDFATLANLKVVVGDEGFDNLKFKYMEGYWVMMEFQTEVTKLKFQENSFMNTWFSQIQLASSDFNTDGRVTWVESKGIQLNMWSKNTINRVASRWGVLLDVDDQEDEHFHRKRICININVPTNIFESFKLIYRGKVFLVRAKEVPGWILDFVKENDKEEDSEVGSYDEVPNGEYVKNVEDLEGDSDGEIVPDTKFEEDFPNQKGEEDSVRKGHFKKSEVPKSGGFILQLIDDLMKVRETMRGDWMPNGKKLLIISVYAPQKLSEKKMSWDYLSLVMSNWEGEVVIMGDFNEVRTKSERFGTLFNRHGAYLFNRFISNAGLEEVPLEGCLFTWCHRSATKMSKLDRFIISDSLLCSCPNISSITLDRYLSDHRAILMREDALIIESNALVRMMKKLNYLKEKIRIWNKLNKEKSHKSKRSLLAELADCDAIIDKGVGENNVVNRITEVVNLLQEVEKKNSLEVAQKTKIKWAIEGDENSKYYHGVINKKRNQLSIRGILVEGSWIDSPSLVKILKDEIKKAVWDCGIDKSPGPDGFTFGFYRRPISLIGSMYKIISKILANRLVVVLGGLKKKQSLVFKVDFEKAYDSVRWDHLDDIMRNFGFGEKWCMWIQSCLRSSRGSVIVNGSPTEEFQFYKGLKQGDPLYPFLFILVMENLHISFQQVVDVGLFKGIEVASSLNLSHMFYANDAIFIGQWSESNIDTIVKVLDCYNRAYGLRINMTKSKLLGISVKDDKVKQAAAKIGCNTLKTPFSYSGSKVGGCMSRIQSWIETIERMACQLSKWKLKTLSIRGGLGVSSLFALNRALMFKWVWRFITQGFSLWARVIKALHGYDEKLVRRLYALETQKKIDVASKFSHSGLDVSFRRPPRGGVELQQFEHMKEKVEGCILAGMMDRWFWALKGSGEFTRMSVRKMIDDFMLPEVSSKTRWIKVVPIKVYVHALKVKLDGLPTRLNISRKGIDIESILYPVCGKTV
nr:RNA-directed DNA polymerase, eukaryota, reverse transcriptase zinc-binding domain protein [Tanacetum cinerariifolium]